MYIRKRTWKKNDGKQSTRYYVVWQDEYGKRYEEPAGSTKKSAELLVVRLEREKSAGTLKPPADRTPPNNPIFKDFCDLFLKDRQSEIKASTLADYKCVINRHLIPFFGKQRLSSIGPARVLALVRHLDKEGVSPSTSGKVLRVLRVIMRHALVSELIDRDPCLAIRAPKVDRQPVDFLTVDEAAEMLEAADGFMKPLLAVAAYAGLRQGEILALRWSDLDFKKKAISVTRSYRPGMGFTSPKTATSVRTVPMVNTLKEILVDWRPHIAGPDDLVFPNEDGGPLDRANLIHRKLMAKKESGEKPKEVERFESILTRAGIRRIRFHDLRHTFASLSIEAGVDVKTLQGIMGHSSITVTMDVYGHLYTSSLERAGIVLDNHISGGLKVIPTLKSVEI